MALYGTRMLDDEYVKSAREKILLSVDPVRNNQIHVYYNKLY
jgi:hypothetical protein